MCSTDYTYYDVQQYILCFLLVTWNNTLPDRPGSPLSPIFPATPIPGGPGGPKNKRK